ncbi:YifB family Mg chelatase-like AAA ATPase [Caldimonas brevitalea]|uniref:ATP-dependent protease n=1 Tax=Caldimonas brevitalea TaxID=413882 RepID=A0A0G3BQL5_9BURK|nr:YifB family Mg chelatase-like AAA ATPase [Caldimonas brevitalea]AKJ31734.1 ATP-dependent protease [Caldimonas brevitalea]
MSLAVIRSRALAGLQAPEVTVEVHLANGLPSFTLVGLADTEVKEARERVRAALLNSGLTFPHNKRITVNLAPADLPKESGRFDLPIALGILVASGQLPPERVADHEFAGELSLAGDLRPVRGALAMSLALHRQGAAHAMVLPWASAEEAALVEPARVYGARHLLDVVQALLGENSSSSSINGDGAPGPHGERRQGWQRVRPPAAGGAAPPCPDLRDVKGQSLAKRALEVAAAGGHSVLMVGPPGSGKSMLAQRFAGLLPPLSTDAALESAALLSLAGGFEPARWRQRVFRSPHHSASSVALVGGGSPPRPGEISLAHHGVLFLDELPEWSRAALEALREPLESGRITISRAARQSEFPAQFQFIAAMNPCPCGWYGSTQRSCRCSPDVVARYQGRLSGPLLDRLDLHVEVGALSPAELRATPDGEPSAAVAQRVSAALERQQRRQGVANAQLDSAGVDRHCALGASTADFLCAAAERLGWSARSYHRVLKLARTVADLAGADTIERAQLAEAIQLRRGLVAG